LKVGDSSTLTYNTDIIPENIATQALQVINTHNGYKIKPYNESLAYKNATSSRISQVIEDLRNVMAAYTPINIDDPHEAAKNSSLGDSEKTIIMDNPAAINVMQVQNMDGKDVIGIAAVGEKIFFASSFYFNEGVRSGSKDWADNMFFFREFKFLNSDPKKIELRNLIANINLEDVKAKAGEYYFRDLIEKTLAKNLNKEQVSNIVKQDLGFTEDQSLVISSLLSAATDNAKELVLSKINAGKNLASVYMHLIMMGFDFKDIAKFMTSPTIQLISDSTKSNIFDDYNEKTSVDEAIKLVKEGPSLDKYAQSKIYVPVINNA